MSELDRAKWRRDGDLNSGGKTHVISSHARYQAMRPRQCFRVQPFGYEHDGDITHESHSNLMCVAVKLSPPVAHFTATVA